MASSACDSPSGTPAACHHPVPIDSGTAPCYGDRAIYGQCDTCGQKVPYKLVPAANPGPGYRNDQVPEPHTFEVDTYLLLNPGECSCGGWHGELGDIERVSCLREKIGGEPKITHSKCGRPWHEHLCPGDSEPA